MTLSKHNTRCAACNIPVSNPTAILKIKPKLNLSSPLSPPIAPTPPITHLKTISHLCPKCITKDSYEKVFDLLSSHNLTLLDLNHLTHFLCNNDIYILKRDWRHYVKHTLNVKIRKEKLFKKLAEEKLQYQKNGICDAYIKHGRISLDEVISVLLQKQIQHNKKLQKLVKTLDKNNLSYDPCIPAFQRYLNSPNQDIDDVIQEAEIERILIRETNYADLLKKKDIGEARDISLMRCKTNKKIIKKTIMNKITLKFD